jgi:hypothetical protein
MTFTGMDLLRVWDVGRENGLSQRRLAKYLGMPFNSLHGKIFRQQKKIANSLEMTLSTYKPVLLKGAVFDIETMSFATGGIRNHIVCTCILSLDSDEIKTMKLSFKDHHDDRRVLEEIIGELSEYDILIGHNIAEFDFNWLNSRLIYHGMNQPDKRWLYYDTYQRARAMAIKADRKSLGFLADFFRIEGSKTSVMPVSWSMIDSPKEDEFEKSLADIIYHCECDVRLNRELFFALWARDRLPNGLPVTKKW